MLKRMRLPILMILLATLSACAPDSGKEETGYVAPTAPKSTKPVVSQENGYSIARGATQVQDVSVKYDPKTKAMTLQGKIEYLAADGGSVQSRPLDLKGVLTADGFIALKNVRRDSGGDQVRVAAKATCLSEQGSCYSSFIDIYLSADGLIYHHQLESHQDPKEDEAPEKPKVEAPKKDQPKTDPPKTETPKTDATDTAEDELESEGGADDVEGEPGQYIGSIADDIQALLNVTPKTDPKKDAEKGEAKEDMKPSASVSQAVGAVNAGRLENAKNMLVYEQHNKTVGYHVIRPERLTHFATDELAYIISKMGQFTKSEIPGYALSVGDLSKEKGGKLGRHKSHQSGLDADVAFFFNNKTFQGYFASAVAVDKPHANWMLDEQWKMFKMVVQTKLVDRIFIHATLKKALCEKAIKEGELQKDNADSVAYQTLRRLIADKEHNNHFHLRVKCSSAQIRCRQLAEPAPGSGCF